MVLMIKLILLFIYIRVILVNTYELFLQFIMEIVNEMNPSFMAIGTDDEPQGRKRFLLAGSILAVAYLAIGIWIGWHLINFIF